MLRFQIAAALSLFVFLLAQNNNDSKPMIDLFKDNKPCLVDEPDDDDTEKINSKSDIEESDNDSDSTEDSEETEDNIKISIFKKGKKKESKKGKNKITDWVDIKKNKKK